VGGTVGQDLGVALVQPDDGVPQPVVGEVLAPALSSARVHLYPRIALDSAERLVLSGTSGLPLQGFDTPKMFAMRLLDDGTRDATFGGGGVTAPVEGFASGLAVQADDRIVIGGGVDASDFRLARYDTAGLADPTFGGGDGSESGAFAASVSAVALQADQKIVAGGSDPQFALARFLTDGSLDPTFGIGGTVTTSFGDTQASLRAVAVQADGALVVVGSTGSSPRIALARYLSSGPPLVTCGNGGLDGDEACDDGNLVNGDCCSALCTVEHAGTVCRAAASGCDAAEVCDGLSASCSPNTGLPDSDGDGLCDAIDPCTGPAIAHDARVILGGYGTPTGDDSLAVLGTFVVTTSPAPDPRADGLRVLVQQAFGDLLDVTVPGGAYERSTRTGWSMRTRGTLTIWRFRTPLLYGAVNSAVVKVGPTEAKVVVRGSRAAFASGTLELPLRATIVLAPPRAATGRCGALTFTGATDTCKLSRDGRVYRCKQGD
jgi:uncharacterized delta-60 repeat protein